MTLMWSEETVMRISLWWSFLMCVAAALIAWTGGVAAPDWWFEKATAEPAQFYVVLEIPEEYRNGIR
jgi:hypothetical protein